MAIGTEIADRLAGLAAMRAPWVKVWRDVADLCLPMSEYMPAGGDYTGTASLRIDALAGGPQAADRGRRIYDSGPLNLVDRLASGMESMVTPRAEKWHGLALDDVFDPDASDEEAEFFDRLRDLLFTLRYDARTGFATAHQKAMRSTVSLGTAVVSPEEAFGRAGMGGREMPILYRYIPLTECHLATDDFGEVDTNYRRMPMTARQALQRFGARCPERVKVMAESSRDRDRAVEFIHAVFPRAEAGSRGVTNRDSAFASFIVWPDTKEVVSESGFFSFPFIVYHWQQSENSAYGESPAMLALADIKSLNAMGKVSLQAAHQGLQPPLAVANDGVMGRPNLNPGAINMGGIDEQGRSRIQPIITAQPPNFVEAILNQKREAIRDSFYVNLFQVLIQNPQMTATEAMIRANEKGELLGPAGAKIQRAMAFMVDRELDILERRGLYQPGSSFEPPASLAGKTFHVRFTSPLDRIRRQSEAVSLAEAMQLTAPLVEIRPDVVDNIDYDAAYRGVFEVKGVPRAFLKRKDEVEKDRAERAQVAQQRQDVEDARAAGEAGQAVMKPLAEANALANGQQPVPAEI